MERALLVLMLVVAPGSATFADPVTKPVIQSAEYVPPDFSEKCPSSEERAKVWNTKLLKPDELIGPLAFLNVPYPKRDFLAAKKLFDANYPYASSAAKVDTDFADYREQDTGRIQ